MKTFAPGDRVMVVGASSPTSDAALARVKRGTVIIQDGQYVKVRLDDRKHGRVFLVGQVERD